MPVDQEAQTIYDELASRGVFKADPEAQAIGHELRSRGVVSDPTQGGLYTYASPAGVGMGDLHSLGDVNQSGAATPSAPLPMLRTDAQQRQLTAQQLAAQTGTHQIPGTPNARGSAGQTPRYTPALTAPFPVATTQAQRTANANATASYNHTLKPDTSAATLGQDADLTWAIPNFATDLATSTADMYDKEVTPTPIPKPKNFDAMTPAQKQTYADTYRSLQNSKTLENVKGFVPSYSSSQQAKAENKTLSQYYQEHPDAEAMDFGNAALFVATLGHGIGKIGGAIKGIGDTLPGEFAEGYDAPSATSAPRPPVAPNVPPRMPSRVNPNAPAITGKPVGPGVAAPVATIAAKIGELHASGEPIPVAATPALIEPQRGGSAHVQGEAIQALKAAGYVQQGDQWVKPAAHEAPAAVQTAEPAPPAPVTPQEAVSAPEAGDAETPVATEEPWQPTVPKTKEEYSADSAAMLLPKIEAIEPKGSKSGLGWDVKRRANGNFDIVQSADPKVFAKKNVTAEDAAKFFGDQQAEGPGYDKHVYDSITSPDVKKDNADRERLGGKTPWEMIQGEYAGNRHVHEDESWMRRNVPGYRDNNPDAYTTITNDHEYAVKQALAGGKPVPPEVLADYPDLKPAAAPESALPAGEPASAPNESPVAEPTAPEAKPEPASEPPTEPTDEKVSPTAAKITGVKGYVQAHLRSLAPDAIKTAYDAARARHPLIYSRDAAEFRRLAAEELDKGLDVNELSQPTSDRVSQGVHEAMQQQAMDFFRRAQSDIDAKLTRFDNIVRRGGELTPAQLEKQEAYRVAKTEYEVTNDQINSGYTAAGAHDSKVFKSRQLKNLAKSVVRDVKSIKLMSRKPIIETAPKGLRRIAAKAGEAVQGRTPFDRVHGELRGRLAPDKFARLEEIRKNAAERAAKGIGCEGI